MEACRLLRRQAAWVGTAGRGGARPEGKCVRCGWRAGGQICTRKSLAEGSALGSAGFGGLLQDFTWRRDGVRISLWRQTPSGRSRYWRGMRQEAGGRVRTPLQLTGWGKPGVCRQTPVYIPAPRGLCATSAVNSMSLRLCLLI